MGIQTLKVVILILRLHVQILKVVSHYRCQALSKYKLF